jgi:hypothetical protein
MSLGYYGAKEPGVDGCLIFPVIIEPKSTFPGNIMPRGGGKAGKICSPQFTFSSQLLSSLFT